MTNYVWNPSSDLFNDPNNWTPNTKAPGSGDAATFSSDTAEFGTSSTTIVAIDGTAGLGALIFDAGAPAYTFSTTAPLSLFGAGIIDDSSNPPTLQVGSTLSFLNGSAADAVIDVAAAGTVAFSGLATAGTAQITNNGDVDLSAITTGSFALTSISGSGTYHLGDVALTVGSGNANNYTVTGNIVDGGAGGSLIYAGTGTLTLAGTNDYTGGTTINSGGTLQLGNGGSTGSLAGDVTGSGGSFAIDESGSISLGGNIAVMDLTQKGNGTTILTGIDNAATGTNIVSGTLQLGNGGSTGSLAGNVTDNATFAVEESGTVTLAGTISGSGAFEQLGTGTTILTGDDNFSGGTIISAGSLQLGDGTEGSLTGNVTDDGVLAVDRNSGLTLTLDGNITGNGSFQQIGSGLTQLGGQNTYSGATDVNAGTLQGGAADVFSANSAVTVDAGATLDLGFNQHIAALSGAGTVTNIIGTGQQTILTEGDSTNTTFSGVIEDGTGGRRVSLDKVGTGTLTLTGVDSYSGGTTLSAGTLELGNGGSLSSGVTFAGTATLRLDTGVNQIGGNISGAVTGDAVDLAFETFATGDHAVWDNPTGTVMLENGNDQVLARLGLFGHYTSQDFTVTSDANNDVLIELKTDNGVASNYVWSPSNDVFGDPTNWSPDGKAPGSGNASAFSNDTAEFASSGITTIAVDGSGGLGALTFDAGAPAYTLAITAPLSLYGAGIVDNSSNAPTLQVGSTLSFLNGSAADAILDVSAAGTVAFSGLASGGIAQFNNNGDVDFSAITTGSATANAISGSGTYHLGGVALTVGSGNANNYTVTGNIVDGGVGGGTGGSLTYAGTGTLTLAGDNTYTGGTTISGGTLQLGNGSSDGSVSGNVLDNATFTDDDSGSNTLDGTISGSGAFHQIGTGTTILTAADSVTGGTTISAGTLELGSSGSIAQTVTFADTGAAETLRLDSGVTQLGGNIAGFGLNDDIDLGFLGFNSSLFAVWQENGGGTGGTLSLEQNGSTLATLNLAGQYGSANFLLTSDGHGGTTIGFRDVPSWFTVDPGPASSTTSDPGRSSFMASDPGSSSSMASDPGPSAFMASDPGLSSFIAQDPGRSWISDLLNAAPTWLTTHTAVAQPSSFAADDTFQQFVSSMDTFGAGATLDAPSPVAGANEAMSGLAANLLHPSV